MNFVVIYLYVSTVLILRISGIEESKWKLSIDGVAEIRKQTQLQNNHAVKTIRTRHGDLYDCINYYEQPAFNHPLSENLTFIPQKKQTLSHEKARNENFTMMTPKTGLNGGECPNGTVPIKRDTYEDFMIVKVAQGNVDNPLRAKCSAQENNGYSGVSATIAIYNPDVTFSSQYSAAVMKLHIGPDSIEAGWRVDIRRYKDAKTRFYIRTDTRNTHCFNAHCPGFVITQKNIPLDFVFDKVSIPGGQGYESDLSITNDYAAKRWTLRIEGHIEIGYWPTYLFEKPDQLADKVEWGGEVYPPVRGSYPGMGSGRKLTEDTKFDAYFSNVKVKNGPTTGGPSVDPINLKCDDVPGFYAVRNEGNVGVGLEYLIFYGGPHLDTYQ